MSQQTILVDVNSLVEEAANRVKRLGTESEKLQHQWKWLAETAKGAQTGVSGWVLGLTKSGRAVKQCGLDIADAIEGGYKGVKKIDTQLDSLTAKMNELQAKQAKLQANAVNTPAQTRQLAAVTAQLTKLQEQAGKLSGLSAFYHAQNNFLDKLSSVNVKFAALEGFLAAVGLKKALEYNRQLNDSLIFSNSLYANRQALMGTILDVQLGTGNSTQDMAAATKALAGYGLEAHANFKGILKTAVQLEEGLGLSYETSAQLAEVWERRLNLPLKSAGDMLARVVNQTSLATGKAAEFAIQMGKAFANVGLTGAGVTAAIERMTRLEGFINRQGGKAGEISKLVAKMQTTGGMGQAAMLGLSPGQLGSDSGSKRAMDALTARVNQVTRTTNAGSVERMAMMEQLEGLFELSSETLLSLAKATADNNQVSEESLTLAQRWRDQVSNTNKSLDRLVESLKSLMHRGFMPTMQAINWVSDSLAGLLTMASESALATQVLSGAAIGGVTLAMGYAVYKAGSLVKALIQLSAALTVAAARAQAASLIPPVLPTAQGISAFMKAAFSSAQTAGAGKLGAGLSALKNLGGLTVTRGGLAVTAGAANGAGAAGTLVTGGVGAIATVAGAALLALTAGYAFGKLLGKSGIVQRAFGLGDWENKVQNLVKTKNDERAQEISQTAFSGQGAATEKLVEAAEKAMRKEGQSGLDIAVEMMRFRSEIEYAKNSLAGQRQVANVKDPVADATAVANLRALELIVQKLEALRVENAKEARAALEARQRLYKAEEKAQQARENERLQDLGQGLLASPYGF